MTSRLYDCLIVGAGPAGLSAGRYLADRGFRVGLVEALAQVGGRANSREREGFILDSGAAFLTSFYPQTLALARRARLPLIRPGIHPGRSPRLQALVTGSGLVPYGLGSLSGLLRFPLLGTSDKVRLGAAMLRLLAGRPLHIADPRSLASVDTEAADAWGRRWFGNAAYEYVVRSAVEPFFFYETDQVSAAVPRALLRHALHWRLLAPQGGMGELPRALAQGLEVICGYRVESIQPGEQAFVIRQGATAHQARRVILAVPAPAALAIEAPISSEDRADLRSVSYVPNIRLYLAYRRRITMTPSVLTPAGPQRHAIAGVTAVSQWMPHHVPAGMELIGISARAWRSAQLLADGEDAATGIRADCRALGIDLPVPDWTEIFNSALAIVLPRPGHFRTMTRFLDRPRRGIHFAGDWLTGSTIEGAVRSGVQAAQAVQGELLRAPAAGQGWASPAHS